MEVDRTVRIRIRPNAIRRWKAESKSRRLRLRMNEYTQSTFVRMEIKTEHRAAKRAAAEADRWSWCWLIKEEQQWRRGRRRPTDRWKANGFWFGLVHFKSTQGGTTNNNIMWLSFFVCHTPLLTLSDRRSRRHGEASSHQVGRWTDRKTVSQWDRQTDSRFPWIF